MKIPGALISVVIAGLAATGVIAAFVSGASPYVTVDEARHATGDRLHLIGDVEPATIKTDIESHRLTFTLKDPKGAEIPVVYDGDPPSDLNTAKRIVAVGSIQGERFISHQLLIKCPSKYEDSKSGA
jgi:cytochrome c-type biogenesis protein CcmE